MDSFDEEMRLASLSSQALWESGELGSPVIGENSPLDIGSRVYLVTVGKEYPGTVLQDWEPRLDLRGDEGLIVHLDIGRTVKFHRKLFRAWTPIDYLANV